MPQRTAISKLTRAISYPCPLSSGYVRLVLDCATRNRSGDHDAAQNDSHPYGRRLLQAVASRAVPRPEPHFSTLWWNHFYLLKHRTKQPRHIRNNLGRGSIIPVGMSGDCSRPIWIGRSAQSASPKRTSDRVGRGLAAMLKNSSRHSSAFVHSGVNATAPANP